jgi:hypothetical protein
MSRTFVELPPESASLAQGYQLHRADGSRPPAPATDAAALTPAANLSSTVRDLARFVSAQMALDAGDKRVLAPASQREMQRAHWLSSGWASARGLGFSLSRQGNRTLVGHGGWVAGHRSQIAFDPQSKVGVIVLTNSDEGGPGSYVSKAFELVAPALERAASPKPPKVPVTDAARYVGTYHNPWGEQTEVLELDGQLVLFDHGQPPANDIEGSLTKLVRVGGDVFRIDGSQRKVLFERRPDGRVERIKLDENFLFAADCGEIGPDLRCSGG